MTDIRAMSRQELDAVNERGRIWRERNGLPENGAGPVQEPIGEEPLAHVQDSMHGTPLHPVQLDLL